MSTEIEIHTIRRRAILVIKVHHNIGPFYLKSIGMERGSYVRLGTSINDPKAVFKLII
jgi:hypothetical protein